MYLYKKACCDSWIYRRLTWLILRAMSQLLLFKSYFVQKAWKKGEDFSWICCWWLVSKACFPVLKSENQNAPFSSWCPAVHSGKVANTVIGISWVSRLLSVSLPYAEQRKGKDRSDLAPLTLCLPASKSKWSTSNELRFWFFESAQQLHQVFTAGLVP